MSDGVVLATPSGRARRRAVHVALTAVLATVVALAVLLTVGALAGYRLTVVRTASMGRAIPAGSLVLYRNDAAASVRRGEVVVVHSDALHALITHRVVAVAPGPRSRLRLTLRGDANVTREHVDVARSDEVGRVVAVLPHGGWWLDRLDGGYALAALLALAAAVRMLPARAARHRAVPR